MGSVAKTLNVIKMVSLCLQDAFDAYKEEMAEVAETMEIATLDKEMAEEKVSVICNRS